MLVIPEYVLRDESFQKAFMARFVPMGAWKFDDEVYEQFKQICIIGVRRPALGYLAGDYEKWTEELKKELPYLPHEPVDNPMHVRPSKDGNVEYFTTLEFDAAGALDRLAGSPLLSASIGNKLYEGSYMATELGHPIVPLSPDLCYLVSSVGGGQGYAGSSEEGTLHLQRGKAEVVKTSEIEYHDDGCVEKETSSTHITLKVIEADGTIHNIQ